MMMRWVLVLMAGMIAAEVRGDNWPGWRGPNNLGISSAKVLPLSWSDTRNVRWKVALPGAGVSAPIVWEDHLFVTASDGRLNDRLHVSCYHRADGRLRWQAHLFGSAPTDLYPPGGMAVPTPATDGRRVYVLFGTGDLAALDFHGHPVWIRSLAEEYGPFRNRWGMGASPILVGETLYIQVDHWGQSYLLAVDALTGANRWKTDRPASVNWTSPLAVQVRDRLEVITFGTNHVRSYDARDGTELWRAEGMHFQCIPSPVVHRDVVYACSGENTMAIKMDEGRGDVTRTHVLWKNKKAFAFVPSPLLYQDHLYIPGDRGIATCYDARTGDLVWKERLGEQFHASPVGGADRVYFATKEGSVKVVRAGKAFEMLAENPMGEMIVASPALADGQIFLRGEKHLFCIEEPKRRGLSAKEKQPE